MVGHESTYGDRETSVGPPRNPRLLLSSGMNKRLRIVVALTAAIAFSQAPMTALADEGQDEMIDAILQVNPGLSKSELVGSISDQAKNTGIPEIELIEIVFKDSQAARVNQEADRSNMSKSGGGDGDDGYQVRLGCAFQGYYTYSFARNFGVNHGHNVLFVQACQAIHAPGSGQNLTRVGSNHRLWYKNAYPAHIRRVDGASINAHDRAAALAENRYARNLPYNSNFAFNKTVWDNKYNCSQLVWAAWQYSNDTDLDDNGGPGVYPEDLWKSRKTVINRYLTP